MIKILKYEIKVPGAFSLKVPANAEVLNVDTQNGFPFMWIQVDVNNADEGYFEERFFYSLGTGLEMQTCNILEYLGTVLVHGDTEVYHIYEMRSGN